MRKRLVAKINQSAKALKKAGVWQASRVAVNAEADNYVYELYCALRILNCLIAHYHISMVGGSNGRPRFPTNPAAKDPKWSHFSISNGRQALWQLCLGTEILDSVGTTRAPDISLQSANSPLKAPPSHTHVKIIWDAKFKKNSGRISRSEFALFCLFVEMLHTKNAKRTSIRLSDAYLLENCMLTNGMASTEDNALRRRKAVREVESFFPNGTPKHQP